MGYLFNFVKLNKYMFPNYITYSIRIKDMSKFEIHIHNRDYSEWEYKSLTDDKINPAIIDILPLDHKMFHLDTYLYENGDLSLNYSIVRNKSTIAGVLLLQDNRTYGRTENKKRLLYRCIPDNKSLPAFLVPYNIQIGFEKIQQNKYVLIQYDHWNHKHPRGIITETLGDVSNLDAYYDYRIHCYTLYKPISTFTSVVRQLFSGKGDDDIIEIAHNNPQYRIADRRGINIISIDPKGSRDFDDAFGIEARYNIQLEQIGWTVSIYIANVFLFMEHFKLWNILSERVSTIYLPTSKRSMLPNRLSDDLCSLTEDRPRLAFTMDIHIDMDGVIDTESILFSNSLIQVRKNYVYEEPCMKKDNIYRSILTLTKKMDNSIHDSHTLVEYWMIKMNTLSGEHMLQNKDGIYRAVQYTSPENRVLTDTAIDEETNRIIRSWNNMHCQYALYSEDTDTILHNMIDMKSFREMDNSALMKKQPYIHITSPIRRMVDVMNQIILTRSSMMVSSISTEAVSFLDKWKTKIDVLNTDMKAIRKIQTESRLLHECTFNPSIIDNNHEGILFGKQETANGMFKYIVYLQSIKLMSPIYIVEEYAEYTVHQFQIFMFHDADTVVRKVRLHMVV